MVCRHYDILMKLERGDNWYCDPITQLGKEWLSQNAQSVDPHSERFPDSSLDTRTELWFIPPINTSLTLYLHIREDC